MTKDRPFTEDKPKFKVGDYAVHVPIDNGDRLSFIKINKLIKRQD
jgi:hypothetical protein